MTESPDGARVTPRSRMRTPQTAIRLCCCLAMTHMLHAGPPAGYVIEWGWDTPSGKASPARLVLSNAVAVSAGMFHSLALKTDGRVAGWGWNSSGQARGEPTAGRSSPRPSHVTIGGQVLSNVSSIAASREFSLALRTDGTVVTWGENYVPDGITNVVVIAVDLAHSWVLRRDGKVVGWWREQSPSYRLLTAEHLSNIVAIAVGPAPQGGTRGVALRCDGTAGHWGGETDYKDATPPADLSNVVAVAAGPSHSLALKSDGTVVGWGFNAVGQATGTPTMSSPNIGSGPVCIEGHVLDNVVSIAAGRGYSLALRKDGTVVAWGRMVNNQYPATVPEGLSDVVAISAGENLCLAITTNPAVAARFRR